MRLRLDPTSPSGIAQRYPEPHPVRGGHGHIAGAKSLSDLNDVSIANPSNGQALTYDSASKKWIPVTPSGGGGTAIPYIIQSNGTDQTTAINTALTTYAGGAIQLMGNFTITAPLRIPSDTTLIATAATVSLAAGSHCNAVQNYAVQANRRLIDGATNSTTTFTSATAAFVTGDIGKAIRIYYNDGTYLDTTISARTNGTTVTLATAATASQTGLYFCIGGRDRNIRVIGGRWYRATDNYAGGTNGWDSNHFRFRHVDTVEVADLSVYTETGKYAVNVGDVQNFHIHDITGEFTRSDLVHVNGPAAWGLIDNIVTYMSDDDVVSLTGGDFHNEMQWMGDTLGDITDVTVRRVQTDMSGRVEQYTRAVLLLGGQSAAGHQYTLDKIYVQDIRSRLQATPLLIGNDTQDSFTTGGTYGRIIVDGGINYIRTGLSTNPNYFVRVDDSAVVDYLEVRSVRAVAGTDDVYIQGGATVTTLVTLSIDDDRVARDGTVTNYYNDLVKLKADQTNNFSRIQYFHDDGGSWGIETDHIKVTPRFNGGSASMFLDNQNGQTYEFFANNGGSFGLYDQVTGYQPLTIDPTSPNNAIKVSPNGVGLGTKLGVGTTTPAEAVDVVGSFRLRDNTTETKGYRYRTSGANLDMDFSGADAFISCFSGAGYTGTQRNYLRLEAGAQLAHAIYKWIWSDGPYGGTNAYIDGTDGSASFNGQVIVPNATGGTSALNRTTGDARYPQIANNLSDLASAATARTNLGLGSVAVLSTVDLTVNVTGILPVANGGTGSNTQNFVDLSTTQSAIAGSKTFTGSVSLNGGVSAGSSGFRSPPTTRSANTTLTSASAWDNFVDATAAARTITLPAANAANGQKIWIMKIDASANAVTVQRAGTDTINGLTSYSLPTQYKYVELINNNSNAWYVRMNN